MLQKTEEITKFKKKIKEKRKIDRSRARKQVANEENCPESCCPRYPKEFPVLAVRFVFQKPASPSRGAETFHMGNC